MANPTQEWHKVMAKFIAEKLQAIEGEVVSEDWTMEIKDIWADTKGGTPYIFITLKNTTDFIRLELSDQDGPLF
jgi:hypothetical protein